jgi:hypothetical protein
LFARIIAVATIALTGTLAVPGHSQAAGAGAWSGPYHQSKRPIFRPWQDRSQYARQPEMRWRPQRRVAGYRSPAPRYQAVARQPALIQPESRFSAPASRAFARSATSGVRFRPHGRGSSAPVASVAATPLPAPADNRLQGQFRPETRKRMSYEELQAQADTTRQARAAFGMPGPSVGRAPLPMMAYWRNW